MKEEDKINEPPEILYKYRSLENWQWFVDILLNNRLYAAKYTDLNDPMEGMYHHHLGKSGKSIIEELKKMKQNLKICSLSAIDDPLSKTDENFLMWSHYANGHRGVAIGVSVSIDEKDSLRDIEYDGLFDVSNKDFNENLAKEILRHKSKFWDYEKEWRVCTTETYVKVEIKTIIMGSKMKKDDKKLVRRLVDVINSERKSERKSIIEIKQFQIKKNENKKN